MLEPGALLRVTIVKGLLIAASTAGSNRNYYLLPPPKAQTLIYRAETALHGQMPSSKPCHAGLKRGELWRRWISRIKSSEGKGHTEVESRG